MTITYTTASSLSNCHNKDYESLTKMALINTNNKLISVNLCHSTIPKLKP